MTIAPETNLGDCRDTEALDEIADDPFLDYPLYGDGYDDIRDRQRRRDDHADEMLERMRDK